MRLVVCALAVLLALAQGAAAERMVTDSAGRQVAVPDRIERVFAAGPPALVLLYVLAPDRMIGWPRAPHPEEMAYIAPAYRDLPEVGWLTGRGDTRQPRGPAAVQARPDLRLRLGARHLRLARRAGPGADRHPLPPDRRHLRQHRPRRCACWAACSGVEERAERDRAPTSRRPSPSSTRSSPQVPEDARPRVYLARGPAGLETGLRGSINTEIIERVGAVNVASDPSGARRGLAQVPVEQVVVWNPEIVITWDRTFYQSVADDFYWQGVDAVAERPGLSQPDRAVRLDRPAALGQPA